MAIQQPERMLSVLVSFSEKRKSIIEELLRQCASYCVFDEHLNEWRVILIEFVEGNGVCVFKNTLGYLDSLTQHFCSKGKEKAIPLQALTGPESSRRLRLPNFKTIGI
jgi:hypothetical protein